MRRISLTVNPEVCTGVLHPDNGASYLVDTIIGRLWWDIAETGGADLLVEAPGYHSHRTRALLPEGSNELPWGEPGQEQAIPLDLAPIVAPSLQRVSKAGLHFYTADGQRFVWKGISSFLLYKRWLDGEDISSLTENYVVVGANLVRVFGMVPYQPIFDVAQYSAYYKRLPEFARWLAGHGLYLEFTTFAGRQDFTIDEQFHFRACCDQLRNEPNVFIELCNEYSKNGIDPRTFTKPAGLLASAGSEIGDTAPAVFWDFFGWHGRRDWAKLANLDDMLATCQAHGVVGIHDEPIGFADFEWPGRRTTSRLAAQSIASEGARLGDGATFHCESGLRSLPLGALEHVCAREFFKALEVK